MVSSKKTASVSNPSMGMTPSQIRRRLRFSFHIHNVKDHGAERPWKRNPNTLGLTPQAGEPRGLAGADFDFKRLFIQKVSSISNRNRLPTSYPLEHSSFPTRVWEAARVEAVRRGEGRFLFVRAALVNAFFRGRPRFVTARSAPGRPGRHRCGLNIFGRRMFGGVAWRRW